MWTPWEGSILVFFISIDVKLNSDDTSHIYYWFAKETFSCVLFKNYWRCDEKTLFCCFIENRFKLRLHIIKIHSCELWHLTNCACLMVSSSKHKILLMYWRFKWATKLHTSRNTLITITLEICHCLISKHTRRPNLDPSNQDTRLHLFLLAGTCLNSS